jgi:hypothetical protein
MHFLAIFPVCLPRGCDPGHVAVVGVLAMLGEESDVPASHNAALRDGRDARRPTNRNSS